MSIECERNPIVRDEAAPYLLCKVYKVTGDDFMLINIWGGDVAFHSTLSSADTSKIRITNEDTLFTYRFTLIEDNILDQVIA